MTIARTTDFVSSLQNAARDNPISAVMIGTGVAWMLFGSPRVTAALSMLEPATEAIARNTGEAVHAVSDAASSAREGVRSAKSSAADRAKDGVEEIRRQTADAYETVREKTSIASDFATETFVSPLVENLKQAFKRQPLLIGGVGLAIGSVIAATLPRTKIEIDTLGDTAQYVSSEAGSIAEAAIKDVSEKAERAVKAMGEEASAQGLTSEALKSGIADIGHKIKNVAKASQDSSKT